MKSIKEIVTKPSEAIQAMVDGLLKFDNDKFKGKFKISMDTFGGVRDEICYGCAATCTILKITNKRPTKKTIMDIGNQYLKDYSTAEIREFENAIDIFRIGRAEYIFNFYNINLIADLLKTDWCLSNTNWKEQIPKIQAYIELLKKHGF
jgi:hypothetical protein